MKPTDISARSQWLLEIFIIGAIYFVVAKFSLLLAFEHTNASPVWPPSAFGFLAILLRGYRVWPGILAGAIAANILTFAQNQVADLPTLTAVSFFIAVGNVSEAVCGKFLFNRFIASLNPLNRTPDVLKFALIAILMSLVSASVGPVILCLSGMVPWSVYQTVFFTWWVGDAIGILTFSPLVFANNKFSFLKWEPIRYAETLLFLTFIFIVSMFIFGGQTPGSLQHYPLNYLLLPIIVLSAFRFGQMGVAMTILITTGIAIGGTISGFGPFAQDSLNLSLLLLQSFVGTNIFTGLVLAATLTERNYVHQELQYSQQKLKNLIENATIGLHWINQEGIIIWANKAELDLLGYARDEFVSHHISEFHIDKEAILSILHRLRSGETVHNIECRLRCKDGSEKYVLFSSNAFWEDGKFIHTQCFTRDITERKIAQNNLLKLKDNLEYERNKLEQVLSIEEGLNSVTHLNRLIDFVVSKTSQVLCAKKCCLNFMDEVSGKLYLKGSIGLDESLIRHSHVLHTDPLAGGLALTGKPFLMNEHKNDKPLSEGISPLWKSKSFMVAPIRLNNRFIGTISVADKFSPENGGFLEIDLKILCMITRQVAMALESAKLYQELKYLNMTDELTNLPNYQYFTRSLDAEIKRTTISSRPLCLAMIKMCHLDSGSDIPDNFKRDRLIKEAGWIIKESVREIDLTCRYTTDRFVVILPDANIDTIKNVIEQIMQKLDRLALKESISFQAGVVQSTTLMDRHDLLASAEAAIKQAQTEGKQICYMG